MPRAWVLGIALLLAIFAGAGPGVYLINPDATADAGQSATVAGVPVLYAWYLFWLGVEAVVVVAAFLLIWRKEDASEE